MAEPWDDSLKTFINENPQDFASWLLGEVQVKKKLQTEFKTRTIRADGLLEVVQHGNEFLLQIEFQSSSDLVIGERLLEYSFEAKRTHKLPVHSCVIYLKEVGEVPKPLCAGHFLIIERYCGLITRLLSLLKFPLKNSGKGI